MMDLRVGIGRCTSKLKRWIRSRINGHVHNVASLPNSNIVPWVTNCVDEFRHANGKDGRVENVGCILVPPWRPPDSGLFKVNTDATIDVEGNKVGIWVIIRDCRGSVMASSAQPISAAFSPQVTEAVAILRDLHLALDCGLLPCSLESDAQVVVNFIDMDGFHCSEVGLFVKDIRLFLERFPLWSISFTPRSANVAAHCLVKLGLSFIVDRFWIEECPPSVYPVVLGNCPTQCNTQHMLSVAPNQLNYDTLSNNPSNSAIQLNNSSNSAIQLNNPFKKKRKIGSRRSIDDIGGGVTPEEERRTIYC
ncbi:hypothetical protein EZV62_005277 [Acer yangbiense]|uniref:RNase H type-1 domain-containing protein n=1 Tax=Acer yangbiense TaxID=1000413 RepID=A0A5C7IPG1_9ROSI|nr:hypothetical protein EZV62_005277 [Acer yangbiense]